MLEHTETEWCPWHLIEASDSTLGALQGVRGPWPHRWSGLWPHVVWTSRKCPTQRSSTEPGPTLTMLHSIDLSQVAWNRTSTRRRLKKGQVRLREFARQLYLQKRTPGDRRRGLGRGRQGRGHPQAHRDDRPEGLQGLFHRPAGGRRSDAPLSVAVLAPALATRGQAGPDLRSLLVRQGPGRAGRRIRQSGGVEASLSGRSTSSSASSPTTASCWRSSGSRSARMSSSSASRPGRRHPTNAGSSPKRTGATGGSGRTTRKPWPRCC